MSPRSPSPSPSHPLLNFPLYSFLFTLSFPLFAYPSLHAAVVFEFAVQAVSGARSCLILHRLSSLTGSNYLHASPTTAVTIDIWGSAINCASDSNSIYLFYGVSSTMLPRIQSSLKPFPLCLLPLEKSHRGRYDIPRIRFSSYLIPIFPICALSTAPSPPLRCAINFADSVKPHRRVRLLIASLVYDMQSAEAGFGGIK